MKTLLIRNLTNSPHDLEGGIRLPAMGSVTEKFSDEYAALLRASPGVEVQDADPLDHDGDGKKGGSIAGDPPTLTGKNKAELLAIAASEGVEVEDDMTNADIRSAIELAREAGN